MHGKDNQSAFYLIDDKMHRSWPYPRTNWDMDFRGAGRTCRREDCFPVRKIVSTLKTYPTEIKRDVTEQYAGEVTFETVFSVVSGDGFYLCFRNKTAEAFRMIQRGDAFYAGDRKLFAFDRADKHHIKIRLNITAGKATVYTDGVWRAESTFTGPADSLSAFAAGYAKEDTGEANISVFVKMYKNYLVNDTVIFDKPGELPDDYTVEKTGSAKVHRKQYSPICSDCVYAVEARKGASVTVSRFFARTGGNVCFEIKYLLPKENGRVTLGLLSAKKRVVAVNDGFTAIECAAGVLKSHSPNVWQTLRIEADTAHGTALVRLNGKKVTALPFETPAGFIDGIRIEFEAAKAAELAFTDLFAFVIPPEPADYVPEPVVPKKKGDYYVGMNVCSLWRTGDHHGWDCITPFDEIRPVLGYYDEGLPETADWELKFMAEHGVDFELYCWYAPESNAPFRHTQLSSAIHGGHMLAKYSDKVKIALLWEAANAAHPASREAFRKYFVPYWIDYLFADERYMTVDGKAIMSIFGSNVLVESFGSEQAVKEELDYLRSEVRKLGYRDLIIMACADNNEQAKAYGLDAVHAYNWGKKGYDVDFTKECITRNMSRGFVHVVPTVSAGFNNVGWGGKRSPNMTPADLKRSLEWCRDEILPLYKDDKESWKSKLVMLSTWNEYGEGTYMSPSGLNGFGYLDAVRSVFTEDCPHTDAVPDEKQKKRINILHPADRAVLSPLDRLPDESGKHGVFKRYEFKTKKDLAKWEFHGFASLEIKDGRLIGHSDTFDPYMILKDDKFLPFAADKVNAVRAWIRAYKPVNATCCVEFGCSNDPDGKIKPGMIPVLTVPAKVVPLTADVLNSPLAWQNKITGFRFDPIYAVGDFELEAVEFLNAPPHKTIVLDGEGVKTGQYAVSAGGVTYIPFDTRSKLTKLPELYYEWHKSENALVIRTDKEYVFIKDSDTVLCDGKERRLASPLAFRDGLPLIEAGLYAEIIGRSYRETADEIWFAK